MAAGTHQQSVWSLQGDVAELKCDHLTGQIDTTRPQLGLQGAQFDDSPTVAALFGVYREFDPHSHSATVITEARAWPLTVSESYVRGDDLVASYEPVAEWPFLPQLYWRANSLRSVEGELASLSLLVSVQTKLLDSHPQIGIASQLPNGELLILSLGDTGQRRIEAVDDGRVLRAPTELCCIVARVHNSPYSYAEIMAASDFHELAAHSGNSGISIKWGLFSEFLEKGVIRRARVHAILLPRENDIELAAACCEAAQQLELPLTT